MQFKYIFTCFLLSLTACILFTHSASASSTYDDLTSKVTTSNLINYVDNYYGMTCGSPTDDYADKWLFAFKQQNSNSRSYHPDAVASLDKAIKSTDGAYAVVYGQKNNHDNTSNPEFITVYWTEQNKNDFEMVFSGSSPNRSLIINRKTGKSSKLHSAVVGSSHLRQGGRLCNPEFLWGYEAQFDTGGVSINENSSYKLFTSSFNVVYPESYSGDELIRRNEALSWTPSSSPYDDLVSKITTKKLINKVDNYYGMSCGSLSSDYSDRWLEAFKRQKHNNREYHFEAVSSLERAMANG